MKYTKEVLPTKMHWWYYAYLVIAGILLCLWMPVQVSASDGGEKSHVALVIEQQEKDSSSPAMSAQQGSTADAGQLTGKQKVQTEHITTSRMLQHVFVVVFGGVACVVMGVSVLIWHIRQDKADDAYTAGIRDCGMDLSGYKVSDRRHEKENYGGRTVFIRQKQA